MPSRGFVNLPAPNLIGEGDDREGDPDTFSGSLAIIENHYGGVWTPPQFGSDEPAKTFNWLLFKKAAVGFMSAG